MQKQVVKYPIVGLNQDDDDVTLPIGFAREIRNAIPKNAGLSKASGVQNVPGTLPFSNSLPGGTNTCIGAFSDRANNRIFYFIHNTSNNHSVWYFNPSTSTHTQVLSGSALNFSSSFRINSCSFIEDTMVWTDNYNEPRMIVVADAVAGKYNVDINQLTALQKYNPHKPPATSLASSSLGINNLVSDSWQFAFRIVYYDNTVSLFSPLSKVQLVDSFQNTANTNDTISVVATVPPSITNLIKKVQFAYVKNGDGKYFLFAENTPIGDYTFAQLFKNNGTSTIIDPTELGKTNFVPNKSGSVVVNNQRVVVTMDEYDDSFGDQGTPSLSLATAPNTAASYTDPDTLKVHLPDTSYTYGIVYFDWKMRSGGVTAKSTIKIPSVNASGSDACPVGSNVWVNWSLSGTPPSWAKYYAIVRKKNNSISSYCVTPSLIMFYANEDDHTNTGLSYAAQISENGKIFYRNKSSVPSISSFTDKLYFKVPSNLPLSIDNSYRVRILNNIGQTKTEPILDIIGDKIVVGNNGAPFGISNWSSTAVDFCYPVIRIEKVSDSTDEFFYEIGDVRTITAGAHDSPTGTSYGDNYILYSPSAVWGATQYGYVSYGYPGTNVEGKAASGYLNISDCITQSPVASVIIAEDRKSTGVTAITSADVGSGILGSNIGVSSTVNIVKVYAWDYTKICSDNGRSWIEVLNKQISYRPNTLSISDNYVVESKINGLSRLTNLYVIPPNNTKAVKLVNVSYSGLFMAIHERSITTLAAYAGDRFAPNTDGSQVQDLLQGTSIIAYDNELVGGYGTIYPESVVEHGGKIYGFDPYKGDVWRYAANGIIPIGSVYKMKSFFKTKGSQFIDKTNRNVFGGYDPNLQMYILTFRSSNSSEEETIGFIDKPGEERWISFYDYKPERYVEINNSMYSFIGGQLYQHNVSSVYNNFHGSQYSTKIKNVLNAEFSHDKILRNISTESNSPWSFPSIIAKKTATLSQETALLSTMFVRRGDVYFADVRRDKNTPGLSTGDAIARGNILIGKSYEVQAQNSDTTMAEISYINFGYQKSDGHRIV